MEGLIDTIEDELLKKLNVEDFEEFAKEQRGYIEVLNDCTCECLLTWQIKDLSPNGIIGNYNAEKITSDTTYNVPPGTPNISFSQTGIFFIVVTSSFSSFNKPKLRLSLNGKVIEEIVFLKNQEESTKVLVKTIPAGTRLMLGFEEKTNVKGIIYIKKIG